MTENPYSPTEVEGEPRLATETSGAAVVREILKYIGAYLLGIVAAIALTPVELDLGGNVPLFLIYPILAPVGYFLFYLYLEGAYLPFGGKGTSFWVYVGIGLLPYVMEALAFLVRSRLLSAWRPLWIGFPIGFVGTLGVYYTAAASI